MTLLQPSNDFKASETVFLSSIVDNTTVAISSFWSKGTCLLIFLRRFGCRVCAHHTMLLNELLPALMQKHIRCVAIVQEKEEIEDLKNRNLWNGELFYTLDKSVYADLGIQSTNSWNLFSSLFCKKSHTMVNEANAIPGDFHGDLYQLGGVFVVDKTGQCLYEFRQNSFTVSPDVQTVARVMKLFEVMFSCMMMEILKQGLKLFGTIVCSGCVFYVFNEQFYSITLCKGSSMEPTIHDGELLIVKSLVSQTKTTSRGDVVVAVSPEEPSIFICKRVVAVEGEPQPSHEYRRIRTGHVWLEGDNKRFSRDSRHYGDVPFALLKGKIWPWKNRGTIY
ncbi:Mitochondrial inner membrane protease subunit 1 [Trichinella pseudospiralis]|uniref:Mitochondrial inner membrane protease subunit 1 n=1 Tax=Trichinella pseudospiralis TaxID=6337 RepID=A0A0V1JX73_TRIPS|nr:Mitochondrial inner membrane protease subunit 1 [Trichinella pseudospiralis]